MADEANGNGGDGDGDAGDDSSDFRTPADYDDLVTLGANLDDLGVAYEGLGCGLSAFGPDVASLEQDQVTAFWERWLEHRAEADELRDRLEAESLRLTKRRILRPPWHL